MIAMSKLEQIRRLDAISHDDRYGRLDRERAMALAELCFDGGLPKLLADANLCSNKSIAEFFGVGISTASKWQAGSISVPSTHHLVRLARKLSSQRVAA